MLILVHRHEKIAYFRDFQVSAFIFLAPIENRIHIDNRTHPALVLCSSYITLEAGVNQNDIPIRKREVLKYKQINQPKCDKPKMRERKLRSDVHWQGTLY